MLSYEGFRARRMHRNHSQRTNYHREWHRRMQDGENQPSSFFSRLITCRWLNPTGNLSLELNSLDMARSLQDTCPGKLFGWSCVGDRGGNTTRKRRSERGCTCNKGWVKHTTPTMELEWPLKSLMLEQKKLALLFSQWSVTAHWVLALQEASPTLKDGWQLKFVFQQLGDQVSLCWVLHLSIQRPASWGLQVWQRWEKGEPEGGRDMGTNHKSFFNPQLLAQPLAEDMLDSLIHNS